MESPNFKPVPTINAAFYSRVMAEITSLIEDLPS